jgi:hypothetical protein
MTIENIHPSDELAAIREEIKQLEARESYLRDYLLKASDAERDGKQYRAFVTSSTRESIDKASIVAALGKDVVEPFIKRSAVNTLKVARKQEAA